MLFVRVLLSILLALMTARIMVELMLVESSIKVMLAIVETRVELVMVLLKMVDLLMTPATIVEFSAVELTRVDPEILAKVRLVPVMVELTTDAFNA